MSSYDERLTALEQTAVTRTEFTKAMNDLTWQIRKTLSDRNQETLISLGLLTEDVRILKENVTSLRIRVNDGFSDLNQELYTVDEKLTKRFVRLETRVDVLDEKLTKRFVSLEEQFDKRFVSLEEQFDKRFVSLETRVDELDEKLTKRFVSLETRFGSLETRVNEHTTVLNQHTDLLTQILARLPEKP